MQEVRVAQTGVQILFALLLALAFQARFASVTHFQRDAYAVTLMLYAVTWWFALPAYSRIRHAAADHGSRPEHGQEP